MSKYPSSRLFCLDLLRGLDMFLLVALGPLIGTANGIWHFESDAVHRQFLHAWGEFHFWDIIMPLFIFMCGAAVPFALGKRMKDGRPLPGYWRHVLGRVAFLWFCGMLVQGSLASLDWHIISPYCNTLQAIAAGYLIAAGLDQSVTTDSVGGQGFTAIMVAWLAKFNPILMILTSGIIIFLNQGADQISTSFDVSGAFPNVIVGIVLFFIIGSEFFINYEVHFRHSHKEIAEVSK